MIALYERIAELSLPLCSGCPQPYACCERSECYIARESAPALGLGAVPFDESAPLPYLGPDGCRLPPHARPRCAVHVCADARRRASPAVAVEIAQLRQRIAES